MKNPVGDKKTRMGMDIKRKTRRVHRSRRGGSYEEPTHYRGVMEPREPRNTGVAVDERRYGSHLKPPWKEKGTGFRIARAKK